MPDLTTAKNPGFNWRVWGTLVLFVLILVVGLAAGIVDRSAARYRGQRLAGPDRHQRLEALARLARFDHLAVIARRSLIKALDDDRLPDGHATAGRMLAALVPTVVSHVHIDLSPVSIAGRAAAILLVVVPLDYAGFHDELTRQRASVRRRAAGLLGSVGFLNSAKSLAAITILKHMLHDPNRCVRRQVYHALVKIMESSITHGSVRFVLHGFCSASVEVLIGADPVLAIQAANWLQKSCSRDNFVVTALREAWLTR